MSSRDDDVRKGEPMNSVERGIAIRDAFLATVAEKLEARIEALAAESSPAKLRRGVVDLLGFARELRLIAHPRRPVPIQTKCCDLLAIVADVFNPKDLAKRGFVVEARRSGAIEGDWDEGHLSTILGELVSNAVKYGGGLPITVHVRVERARACIIVSNQGTWGGPRVRPARFSREEIRASVRGFGVGLWLVARLAKAHGGRVAYTASDGETRAKISLPFVRSHGGEVLLDLRLTTAQMANRAETKPRLVTASAKARK